MKLIITDPHIEEKYINELEKTFQEILGLVTKLPEDTLIMCGDYYNSKKPNAKEILFGTKWAMQFKEHFKTVIFLRGNHDKTQDISAIDYLQYLGINIVNDYVDEDNNFYGHCFTNESKFEYGTYKYTISQLAKYNRVFLGHQHSFQAIKDHIWHIGSVRYVGFGEVSDKSKYILKLGEKLEFLPLKSPIPMVDVKTINELPNIDPNNKVRLVIGSFEQFKREINKISKWKDKFTEFKLKLEFGTEIAKEEKIVDKGKRNLAQLIAQYIEKIEDKDVKELLKNQMQ